MDIRTDRRGQAIQVGAVLLFATVIVLFSTYQATMVPNGNQQVEYQHSQRAQSQLTDIRNTIAMPPKRGESTGVKVALGTTYPSRTVGVNPSDPVGTLNTVGTTDSNINLQIKNADAVRGTPSFWEIGDRKYNTGALVYEPDYNEYQAPKTVYEHRTLYNAESGTKPTTIAEPSMISGRNIDLTVLNGSLAASSDGTRVFDVKTIDRSQRSIQLKNDGSDPLEIAFHSRQPASYWNFLEDRQYVEDVSSTSATGEWERVTLTLTKDVIYDVTITKVGIGTQTADRQADGTKVSMVAADSVYRTQFNEWSEHPRPSEDKIDGSEDCDDKESDADNNYFPKHHPPVGEAPFIIGGACNDAFADEDGGSNDNEGTERTYTLPSGQYQVGVEYWTLQSWDDEDDGKAYWRVDGSPEKTETWNYGSGDRGNRHYNTFTVDHPGGEATLEFTATLDQSSHDETFAINDVWIRHYDDDG